MTKSEETVIMNESQVGTASLEVKWTCVRRYLSVGVVDVTGV